MQLASSMRPHSSDSLCTSSASTVATSLRISCSTSREPCWKSAMTARALGMGGFAERKGTADNTDQRGSGTVIIAEEERTLNGRRTGRERFSFQRKGAKKRKDAKKRRD